MKDIEDTGTLIYSTSGTRERPTSWPAPSGDFRERPWVKHLWSVFDIGIRCLYPIDVCGREHFSQAPSTLIVSNHRRDSDGPILASVLLQRRGLRVQGIRPYFVAREDLFRRGFLRDYLRYWPAPLRALLLSRLSLRGLLEGMHALPMRRIPERSLGEVLEDVLAIFGDLPLHEVLKPVWLDRVARTAAGLRNDPKRISDVLGRRDIALLRQQHGFSKLNRLCFHKLVPYERGVIDSYLARFVRLLEGGATLILEPEGAVSFDGRLNRLRGALHSLLNRPRVSPRVLPVGITYDSVTAGRQRVFVNIGPEMPDLKGLGRAETDARVATAIRRCMTVTCSQLASDYLCSVHRKGSRVVARPALDAYLAERTRRFAQSGTAVDARLLTRPLRSKRLDSYLACCIRRGILTPAEKNRYRLAPTYCESTPSVSRPEGIIPYMRNELAALPACTL